MIRRLLLVSAVSAVVSALRSRKLAENEQRYFGDR
jgi:hypothetical protein